MLSRLTQKERSYPEEQPGPGRRTHTPRGRFVDVPTVRVLFLSKTLHSQTAISGKVTRRTPHTGPNFVKVSRMEAGPRSAEVMMNASSGPSPALWRFSGIASGTVVIEHPGKAAPTEQHLQQLRHPRKRSRRPMTACDQPLHTGGKHQSESERRRRMANETGELVPNRQHHLFLTRAESCFNRASTVKDSLRSSSSGAMSDFAAWLAARFGRVDHRDSCNDAAFPPINSTTTKEPTLAFMPRRVLVSTFLCMPYVSNNLAAPALKKIGASPENKIS